ncbi:hydroxyacid dehydrogenase [Ligilactobacillus acidipiscis]|uniref:hydroxyacid dehydrogenase n=1 Tax=Ligilactobacillus acidipiscis TaxID=89059 RepID=UPI0022E3CB61|nr:hydroxyacid dehydrogenase [Ligilactobacillus acidipiscis]
MVKLVYLPKDISKKGKDYLLQKGYNLKIGSGIPKISEGKKADAIILRGAKLDSSFIDKLSNTKIIAKHGVGYENIDVDFASKRGIWVTNTPLANAESVAETTIALMLDLSKNIYNNSLNLHRGDFYYKRNHQGTELYKKTFGIIGFGKIGQEVAKKLQGFGMNILFYNTSEKKSHYATSVSREDLIKNSDFISLHIPMTLKNEKLFGKAEFELMKNTAFLINTSRGKVIDERALVKALKNGQIGGAALDVFSKEPLSLESPLMKLDNVLLTPHIGANSNEAMDRMALHAATEVDRVLTGQFPNWPVNHPNY